MGEEAVNCRVLLVDLNNFSLHPTMAVGYLARSLRDDGMSVHVFSPLSYGIEGVTREPRETAILNVARRANVALGQFPGHTARWVRSHIATVRRQLANTKHPRIIEAFRGFDLSEYDVVLASSYMMYRPVCSAIGAICESAKVPFVVGGSYFTEASIAREWLTIRGLKALISGEVELEIPKIVRAIVDDADLSRFRGVTQPGNELDVRPPLEDLDSVPFPDYGDFDWQLYPHRIIPMLSGRGCGWGACTFCSDVASATGRTFRSRSPENVLEEISFQSKSHNTSLFAFADLKLNSELNVWAALISRIQLQAPNARWIASVHVDSQRPSNGLSSMELKTARDAGLVRLTTGVESGSQRVLDGFAKGTDLGVTSQFLADAASSGISVRVTMIHGTPGETAEDVAASADFLRKHARYIDRIRLSRYLIMMGTTFQRRYDENPSRYPSVIVSDRSDGEKFVEHQMTNAHAWQYARATQKLYQVVHEINRKALPSTAAEFEGVM